MRTQAAASSWIIRIPGRDPGAGPRTAELPNDTNGTNHTNTAVLFANAVAVFVAFVSFVSFGSSGVRDPGGLKPNNKRRRSGCRCRSRALHRRHPCFEQHLEFADGGA